MNFIEEQLAKVKAQEERNAAIIAAIPEKYHHYIIMMEKGVRISNKANENMDKRLLDIGCYCYQGKTYLPLKHAYFSVMGKLVQLQDWAAENGYSYEIYPAKFAQVSVVYYCEKTVVVYDAKGRVIRKSSGIASVGFGGGGIDSTNPLENAETSALGRAINSLGVGTKMENIASYDEMVEAARRETEESAELPMQENQKEIFLVDDLKAFEKDNGIVVKLDATNQETGEPVVVWLKDHHVLQVKNIGLKKGDVIEAILTQIPGNEGSANTFLEFAKAS